MEKLCCCSVSIEMRSEKLVHIYINDPGAPECGQHLSIDSPEAKFLVTSLIHLLGSKLLSEKAARSMLGGILWYSLRPSPQCFE